MTFSGGDTLRGFLRRAAEATDEIPVGKGVTLRELILATITGGSTGGGGIPAASRALSALMQGGVPGGGGG